MANFCGKCGTHLDGNGKCPNCDVQLLSKKDAKKKRKAEKKASKKTRKKEKRAQWSTGKKICHFLLRFILILLLIIVLAVGIMGTLVYFEVVDIPFISKVLQLENTETSDNSNGSMVALEKGFTKSPIIDEESAILAAQEVAADLGYQNAFDELEPYISTSVDDECFYRLQQCYNGIPVYGRYVTVVATKDGAALGITSDAMDINTDIPLSPELSDSQLEETISEYAITNWGILYDNIIIPELSDDLLVIYNQSQETHLAYKLTIINGNEYTVIVDANTGEVLESTSNCDDVSTTGTNIDGTITFPVEYEESDDTYVICDSEREIYIFNLNQYSSGKSDYGDKKRIVTSVGDNVFGNTEIETEQSPEIAINLLSSVEQIADYFESTFEQGIPYGVLAAYYNDGFASGKNARGGNEGNKESTWGALKVGYVLNCTELDILAHEYTHIVEREYDAATGDSDISGAISEGLADTFACFYTGEWDMDITIIGGSHRNASNPAQYNYPSSINDKNKSGEDYSHGYATVVSHAAYLMSESGTFSNNELQMLWYKTLLRLPQDCSYYDLRFCMEQAALASEYSLTQRNAIAAAFNEVGIYDSYKCGNSININVYDKQGNSYDDYNIQINGETSGGLFGIGGKDYTVSANHQSTDIYHIELENGNYMVTITDNANQEVSRTFEISVKESYSIDNLYAFDFGADYSVSQSAEMKVLDINGNEFSDYTAVAYNGDDKYSIQPNMIDLPENNYYYVMLSQRVEELGITYYNMFSLRVKNGEEDILEIPTNFESMSFNSVLDADSVINNFLSSQGYLEYTEDFANSSLEYAIADLNADNIPELLIQSWEGSTTFCTTWVFVVDGQDMVLAHEAYGYGSFRYSPVFNAVVVSPEFRPFAGTADYPFYVLDGTELKYEFRVGQDDGTSYYADSQGRKGISDDERAAYFSGVVSFEWSRI